MTHHPHVHMIVPGGGIARDGERWVACRPGFFLPVRVLAKLFRRRFLDKLAAAHAAGLLQFFGDRAHLSDPTAGAPDPVPEGVQLVFPITLSHAKALHARDDSRIATPSRLSDFFSSRHTSTRPHEPPETARPLLCRRIGTLVR